MAGSEFLAPTYYGFEHNAQFLYRLLQRIDHASPRRFVLVPREVRRRAYAVSPALRELRAHLEAQGWGRVVSCSVVRVCDDYAGAWFMWTMREAAAKAGRMGSGARRPRRLWPVRCDRR